MTAFALITGRARPRRPVAALLLGAMLAASGVSHAPAQVANPWTPPGTQPPARYPGDATQPPTRYPGGAAAPQPSVLANPQVSRYAPAGLEAALSASTVPAPPTTAASPGLTGVPGPMIAPGGYAPLQQAQPPVQAPAQIYAQPPALAPAQPPALAPSTAGQSPYPQGTPGPLQPGQAATAVPQAGSYAMPSVPGSYIPYAVPLVPGAQGGMAVPPGAYGLVPGAGYGTTWPYGAPPYGGTGALPYGSPPAWPYGATGLPYGATGMPYGGSGWPGGFGTGVPGGFGTGWPGGLGTGWPMTGYSPFGFM